MKEQNILQNKKKDIDENLWISLRNFVAISSSRLETKRVTCFLHVPDIKDTGTFHKPIILFVWITLEK